MSDNLHKANTLHSFTRRQLLGTLIGLPSRTVGHSEVATRERAATQGDLVAA